MKRVALIKEKDANALLCGVHPGYEHVVRKVSEVGADPARLITLEKKVRPRDVLEQRLEKGSRFSR